MKQLRPPAACKGAVACLYNININIWSFGIMISSCPLPWMSCTKRKRKTRGAYSRKICRQNWRNFMANPLKLKAFEEGTVLHISKETIKPSAPTPHHLWNLKLSYDQLAPRIYVHLVLFYNNAEFNSLVKSHSLKGSLAKTLTLFYPLAGKLNEDSPSTVTTTALTTLKLELIARYRM